MRATNHLHHVAVMTKARQVGSDRRAASGRRAQNRNEGDVPFVMATSVVTSAALGARGPGTALKRTGTSTLQGPGYALPVQSHLLVGSTPCAAAPEKDTHRSVALDTSISSMRNRRG